MTETDWPSILAAYRRGATADILRVKVGGKWGPVWTVPPCSPEGMEHAGRQFVRSRAESIRLYRRARLRSGGGLIQDVVILTTLPERTQHIRDLAVGAIVVVNYLADDMLGALERAMGMPPRNGIEKDVQQRCTTKTSGEPK